MARTQSTVPASTLEAIIADPARGVISLVGERGGVSLITGEITASAIIMGALAVETEHGTLYLDSEHEITISEDDGWTLVSEDLCAINDRLTALLVEQFDWAPDGDDDDAVLDELTHVVGAAIDDLLTARSPAWAQ